MKKGFFIFLMMLLTVVCAKAGTQFSETEMEASEIAKAIFQNKGYFDKLDETQKAAVCTGAIASYQTCLSGSDAGEKVLQTSKILFEQVYGEASDYESYFTAGEVYGYLLEKTTRKCDSIGDFTTENCQEMMLKNAQFIQKHLQSSGTYKAN